MRESSRSSAAAASDALVAAASFASSSAAQTVFEASDCGDSKDFELTRELNKKPLIETFLILTRRPAHIVCIGVI
jgi:hypothetical protein